MRRMHYTRRASRQFLKGTPYRTPADAVRAGVKSLEEWASVLGEERMRDWLEHPAEVKSEQPSPLESLRHS